ncbi:MAG: hypothetical protein GTO45_01660 [Candidatus Aminicenantes bacterium]|nr:hypothetical protein [Candidatus Aminicenantes bacterium]NIM77468.1 hypothetical protein [Candidatus Aminicenantes bacterium]NIN16773.1 hypothetical protein [Candidatus Aminicenantes bacterium]NIN40629.1 hypothetical protein [Candidatus Aminicenantes bacterium]NIN83450.1 hypothetical protein [Candidatus Aminicenantes bacterium]
MLTITFKNVGHGDTIILEWQNDRDENEIGIIDCHLKNGKSNLAIDHIIRNSYEKIRFVILSHPHTDHFSGFPSLLEFCRKNRIQIERFWHTAAYNDTFLGDLVSKITPDDFFDSCVSRRRDKNTLKGLFEKIHRLYNSCLDHLNKQLVVIQIPHHGSNHSHFDDFWLKIPNRKEVSAIVSVGGQIYGLPKKEVIEFFDKNYKEIHSTNFVGGFKEYFKNKQHKVREMLNQDVSSPFYIYDNHFLKKRTSPIDYDKNFECGEKKIKIEENGFLSIETKS